MKPRVPISLAAIQATRHVLGARLLLGVVFLPSLLFAQELESADTPPPSEARELGDRAAREELAMRIAVTGSLIENGHFRDWKGGVPVAWRWRETIVAALEDEDRRGYPVLKIAKTNAMAQRVSDPPLKEGDWVAVILELKAEEPDQVFVDLDIQLDKEENFRLLKRMFHPGDGKWHTIRLDAMVPNARVKSIQFAVQMKPEASKPIYVSNFRASVTPLP